MSLIDKLVDVFRTPCSWCGGRKVNIVHTRDYKHNRYIETIVPYKPRQYTIIDNAAANKIHKSNINYCFNCGRKLK